MKLKGEKICFSYNQEKILHKLDIQIEAGKLTSITGPNGIGKSTLIKCISNIQNPESGTVLVNNELLHEKNSQDLARILGYVPQSEATNFSITVYEMILLGRRPYIKWKVKEKDKKIVNSILKKLNLTHLAERDINNLSGGERQKVAIARALAQEPEILLLDEPTTSLDLNHQVEVMKLLKNLAYQDNTAVVVVLHDLNLASRFSDYVFLMGERGFHAAGAPEEVFTCSNLKEIYDIEVEILNTSQGNYIIPVGEETKIKTEGIK